MYRMFALIFALSASSAFAAAGPIPSGPVKAVAQARVGDIRLLAWETAAGIEAQALDARTHAPLPGLGRMRLGLQLPPGDVEPRLGARQTRPAVAGMKQAGGETVFLVAWHADITDEEGNPLGTELVGQMIFINSTRTGSTIDPLQRLSRVDDDADPTAASEARSAPVVVSNTDETGFLVLWTHWPDGKTLDGGDPPASSDGLFIYGQDVHENGLLAGETAVRLDDQPAPARNGVPERYDHNVIFLAAVAIENGYLLTWSDPAQESSEENPAQVYTRTLPRVLGDTATGARNPIAQSTALLHGTGRLALAPLPDKSGFLLAWEDARGAQPLRGMLLDADGKPASEVIKLIDLVQPGDDAFLSPQLVAVPGEDRMLLYAVVGTHNVSDTIDERFMEPARLVRRALDPASADTLAFISNFSGAETDAAYPPVNAAFADLAHATGSLPDGKGTVSFTAGTDVAEILVSEFLFASDPPSPPGNGGNPGSRDDGKGGGGAMLLLLFLVPLLRSMRALAFLGGLLFVTAAGASPPDLELLHTEKDGAACYRSVMYREVTEIRIAKGYNRTPIPAGPPVEVISLPTGWEAEVLTERSYQYVKLTPSAFDTAAGISIGRLCLKFPAMKVAAENISYTYDLAATGSPIMATARPDDGISNEELRAMVRRGERLKQGDILDKPKQIEESARTLKRVKDLFD